MRTPFLALLIPALAVLPACGKKKEQAPKAAAGAAKVAQSAGKAAGKAKETAHKAAVRPSAPPAADVELEDADHVVAWLSVRSLGALFDAAETMGGQVGLLPPGASLREGFYRDLTRILAENGITGHEWLDKAKPVHVLLQDDNPADVKGGALVLLPVTDRGKAEAAITAGRKGAEAKGHFAVLQAVKPGQKQAAPGAPEIYIDFESGYMAVSADAGRFAKAKGFAARLAKTSPPSLLYLGMSVTNLARTRKAQIDALIARGGDYIHTMKRWLTDLSRFELTVDAGSGYLRIGTRLHAKAGTKLAGQLNAGKGRDARPSAASLPGNAFATLVADVEATTNLNQLDQSMKTLREIFELPADKAAELDKDIRAAVQMQTGRSALALYRDGSSAAGLMAWVGSRDPAATLRAVKNVIGELGLAAVARHKAERKGMSKAEQAQLAMVERALKERKLEPILTTCGPTAKEAGVTLTANAHKEGGAACDVLDIKMDWSKLAEPPGLRKIFAAVVCVSSSSTTHWSKLPKPTDREAQTAAKLLGERTALAICTGKDRLGFAAGPSALEQARRAVLAKKGGLIDAPVYKAAAHRVPTTPSWLMYLNVGAAVAAFDKVLPPLPVKFPADRPVSVSCGNRARSYACELSVPVQLIAAIKLLVGRH